MFSVGIVSDGIIKSWGIILLFLIDSKFISIELIPERLLPKPFQIIIRRYFFHHTLLVPDFVHPRLDLLELLKFRVVNKVVLVDVLIQRTNFCLKPISQPLKVLNSAKVVLQFF